LGIKPLYVADDGSTLRVASQAKALIAGGGVSAEPSNAGVAGFFLFGSVPEPLSAWDAITAIPAGATVIVSEGGVGQPRLHGSIADFWRDGQRASATGADAGALIRSALADSVRAHLVADVEVGVFLSAGVDSGALLGLGSELGGPMAAVTLGFEEYQGHATDETPLARTVAEHYGARHAVDLIGRSDFRRWLPEILHAMDQPSIDGVNTWMVSRKAAEAGLKVIQSGIGGDELLAGYGSFSSVPKWARRLRPFGVVPGLGRTSRRGFQHLPFLASRPKLPGLLEYGGSLQNLWFLQRALFLPWELPELLGPERSEDGLRQLDLDSLLQGATEPDPGSDLKRIASLEGSIYMRNQLLRDADWAGMAHSLEIRVPFVDVELIRQVGPLLNDDRPPGELKRLAGNAPARPLPPAVLNRSKSNFNVPVGQWAVDLGGYDSWRRVPMLRDDRTPWARRWAYLVADSLGLLLAT
jgi:asparagine synthase (glutamine-hydrolysing)